MRWKGLEHCRIYTSSYSALSPPAELFDWNTAVLLLPFTFSRFRSCPGSIGRLPYYYFLLLVGKHRFHRQDWNTAVLLLPFTHRGGEILLSRLEDCRIITSFYYWKSRKYTHEIGRLPYYYFLLLYAVRFHGFR